MKYNLIEAKVEDINYIKSTKLYNIFNYDHHLPEDEKIKIKRYVDKHIPQEIEQYKIILCNKKRVGCLLVIQHEDGIMLDEIYLEEEYRNKGIGTDIIRKILNNNIVYLWVYKENTRAIKLYKQLGFIINIETETRYYMKYITNNMNPSK